MGAILLFLLYLCFGAAAGSFITILTHRLPIEEDIFLKNSYCPECGNNLRVRSLIPMLSFIFQRGKCLECGKKISFRYFALELINTAVYALLLLFLGFYVKTIYLSVFFSLLLSIVVVDLETYEIPVVLQMLLYVFALLHVILTPAEPLYVIIRAVVYFVIIEILKIITEKLAETEVIGGGDVKLITICGSMLNWEYMSIFLLFTGMFGIIIGLIWRKKGNWKLFPLSPAIVLAFYPLLTHQYSRF
ncbi:MAG: prepilin peptidase [Rickettsiales bacterium]|jgi:prepilin signal peptidase PulO-like enzyme (type II secretory pathway)|nr:prepilin peptidase [Rickettsiales bacterium]